MVPSPQDIWKDIPFFKLYPLLGLKDIKIIPDLFKLGIKWIQIREKEESFEKYFKELKSYIELAEKIDGKIIINDYIEQAKDLKAQGIHLGQEDLKPEEARKILGKNAIIGLSCYTREEIENALENPFIDYIAIGPVFKTPLKDKKPLGIEILNDYVKKNKIVVAIGGINRENISDVLSTGVDKVAFIRFLKDLLK